MKAHSDAGIAEAGIFRSRDGVWKKLSGGLPDPLPYMPYALLIDPKAPGHLYAGMHNGDVWHSADTGDSWSQLPLNLGTTGRALLLLSG